MNKKELVHSLKNIKLVIGNGFDLHCGLKSSFSNYRDYCRIGIDEIITWYEKIKSLQTIHSIFLNNFANGISHFNELSVWDFFFVIISIEKYGDNYYEKLWADVEKDINDSLVDLDIDSLQYNFPINWSVVYNKLTNQELFDKNGNEYTVATICIADVIKRKIKKNIPSFAEYYDFLLNELKQFEERFAKFLSWQLIDTTKSDFGIVIKNTNYFKKTIDTINEICGVSRLSSIDSFNYTPLDDEKISPLLFNINGNMDSPIFGIDSSFDPSNPKFIFTKTSRRMENNFFTKEARKSDEFENVVIYGHSLNKADYNYFFPLFDKIKIMDNSATSIVVFAYSIFDLNKKNEILVDLRIKIFDMFLVYAKEKGIESANRFLDGLTSQNRILLYEIPLINENNYTKTSFDIDLERIGQK